MAKKADLDEGCDSRGLKDCRGCPEYDTCDNCGRRVCKYISVVTDDWAEDLFCRFCARDYGFNEDEIATGRINLMPEWSKKQRGVME